MSVLRKRLDASFTVVPNELLDDELLDLAAKGMVCYMLAKPDGWRFSAVRMARTMPEGRDAILGALKRAEAAGWVKRHDIRKEDGTFARIVTVRNNRLLEWESDGFTDDGQTEFGLTESGSTVDVSKDLVARTEEARTETTPKANAGTSGAVVVSDRWPYFLHKLQEQDDAWAKVTIAACVKIAQETDSEAVSTALSFAAVNAPVIEGSAYGWLRNAAHGLQEARETG